MLSSPTHDQLALVLDALASRLATLELTMQSFRSSHPPPAAHIAHSHANVPADFHELPPKKSKRKGKAKAPPSTPHATNCPQHPSSSIPKALAAKGKQTTKPAAKQATPTFHLVQVFPKEGQTNRMLVTVVIPVSTAAHVIGKGGKGLKQIHDIAGAQVSAYKVVTSSDKCHISL